MDIELSESQNYSSTYQVVPGDLSKTKLQVDTKMASNDAEGGLISEHSAEDRLRYRTRSGEEATSSPPRDISPSFGSGTDEFIDIKVSVAGRPVWLCSRT